MKVANLGEVTIVLGKKNSGKSVYMEALMCDMESFVCIDPKVDHKPPGSTVVRSPAELFRACVRRSTERGNERVLDARIVVHDAKLDEERFRKYLQVLNQFDKYYLVVDEAGNFSDSGSVSKEFELTARSHVSHHDVGLVLGTQFATELQNKVWQQKDHVVIFYYGDTRDSKISDLLDDYATEGAKDAYDRLDSGSYHSVYVGDNGVYVLAPVDIPTHLS